MENKALSKNPVLTALAWASLWGIFEATAGYLLHLISFGLGWLIWYPAAFFFLSAVRRQTGRAWPAALSGLLCATVKMLNLLLPGSIDKVLNPAMSIIFEALAFTCAAFILSRAFKGRGEPFAGALAILLSNTAWRALYALYLRFCVPTWMCEISVISSPQKSAEFFLTQNLITSLITIAGCLLAKYLFKRFKPTVKKPSRLNPHVKTAAVLVLPLIHAALELFL